MNQTYSYQDIRYYRIRAIQISSKDPRKSLPEYGIVRTLLENFGAVDGVQVSGPANTAIVVFVAQYAVDKALISSRSREGGTFWEAHSITAHGLQKTGDIGKIFLSNIVSSISHIRDKAMPNGKPFDHALPQVTKRHWKRSSLEAMEPMAKRPRTENGENGSNSTVVTSDRIATSEPQTNPAPQTPEWMRARIAQLEAELDSAKAARDMATSEHEVIRMANQAEQIARREAMAQKSAAESALSRKEVEQDRLRTEHESATSQLSALLRDVEILRGQLETAENKLNLAQLSSNEFAKSSDRVKALEAELGEAQDRAQKLQLYKSRMEEQNTNPDNTGLDDMRGKNKLLKSEIKQLKSDLASALEQLQSTQRSLESRVLKCSSARAKYERTKEKLGVYKARLENERIIMEKLKETLTPEVYKSLGVMHETLGAFLSAMGSPSVGDEGNTEPKEEFE
ncbi:unnamed protein product [Rhizoctonia solani]|uniref:Uncharacterized protein n=1 Tax=Rhizoctonia solani TaxID=456999 RepID=A0A8H3D143_9AGAM|nr:unnamed protein product [Rhizoctonia solani]